jgi:hypothetical protein
MIQELRFRFLLPLLLLAPLVATAQNRCGVEKEYFRIQPRGYLCARTEHSIAIDGRADEEAWRTAPWTEDFVDIEGERCAQPRFRTRVKMLWDEEFFYFFAEMEEPHVWGTLTERDAVIFHDNDFEIFLDPDRDNHEYYEFEMNALNTVWDLYLPKPYRDGGPADNSWDITGLRSAVHVRGTLNDARDEDLGWTAEIAIPWRAFTRSVVHPPLEGAVWAVNFSRVEWRHRLRDGRYEKVPDTKEDNWVWSPQGVVDMHRPEKWGLVQFVDRVDAQKEPPVDTEYDALMALHRVYWAQKAFHKEHRRWAAALTELTVDPAALRIDGRTPTLRLDGAGYRAEYSLPRHSTHIPGTTTIGIDQDSRVHRAYNADTE